LVLGEKKSRIPLKVRITFKIQSQRIQYKKCKLTYTSICTHTNVQ
jgi:hypothetical protein